MSDMNTKNIVYFVYTDTTNNGVVYYVGKGKSKRIHIIKRNAKHRNVSKKHGQHRKIIATTDDENEALQLEKFFINEFHTYAYSSGANTLACNFTTGGQGVSGRKWTYEQRNIQSSKQKAARLRKEVVEHHKSTNSKQETKLNRSNAQKSLKADPKQRKNTKLR